MRVKMLRTAAGPDRTLIEEREYALPDGEAAALVAGGYAEQVAEPAPLQAGPATEETAPEEPAGESDGQTEEDKTDESTDAQGGS